jgi:Tol biopolymer transport system component
MRTAPLIALTGTVVLESCAGAGPPWGSAISSAQFVFMQPPAGQTVPGPQTGWKLGVMDVDGSRREQIAIPGTLAFLPHFSPDGTRLVYTLFTTGGYGDVTAKTRVALYDVAGGSTRELTDTDRDGNGVWSPDGSRLAFLSARNVALGQPAELWVMSADGSGAHEIGRPTGGNLDRGWGDIAWSSQDWILFVVAELGTSGTCFKTRLDKIRPDGSQRTKVSDGGPNCTPMSMEQSGDADPGFSADGSTVCTSRGFPYSPPGMLGSTVRKLYALSSDPWYRGKPERDLSLPSAPDCVEGVPKGSPDGTRVLLFRMCQGESSGVAVTDTAGSYRTHLTDGFGPDWNPVWKP